MAIKTFDDAKAWGKHFDALSPKLGETAPDFTLYDKKGENPVTLSKIESESPIALVFGSFT